MKKLFTLFVFVLCSFTSLMAEFNGYLWFFGNLSIDFDILDNHPVIDGAGHGVSTHFTNSTTAGYCEIFYTNIHTEYDNNDSGHAFFTNGIVIRGRKWNGHASNNAPANVRLNGNEDATMCAIARKPGSDSLFYIFTLDKSGGPKGLQYSVIDFQDIRNLTIGGVGDTIYLKEANVELLTKIPLSEKVYCTPHENNEDIWVITCELNCDRFYSFLLTANGIQQPPVISHTGHYYNGGLKNMNGAGYMRITPDLRHLIYIDRDSSKILACEFDNVTGKVGMVKDSLILIYSPYGIEFSPNGQHMFVNLGYPGKIVQVKLTEKIFGDTITVYSPPTSQGFATTALQLGPDGGIYFIHPGNKHNGEKFLPAIKNPNGWGAEVNIDLKAVYISDTKPE